MNSNFFNKEFVSSYFPVNLRGSKFFVTAKDKISETLEEFTLPGIFSFLPQHRNGLCSVGVSVVLRLHSYAI